MRRDRKTEELEVIYISSRNELPAEKHIELLNKADFDYECIMVIDDDVDLFK